jgi:dephospho-CoA kinase
MTTRHWPPGELERRESSQFPLDRKRALSHYVIRNNAADKDSLPDQVRHVLSRVLR